MKKILRLLFVSMFVFMFSITAYASEPAPTEQEINTLLEEMDNALNDIATLQLGTVTRNVITEDGLTGTVTIETLPADPSTRATNHYNFEKGESYITKVTKDFLDGEFKVHIDWDFKTSGDIYITDVNHYSRPPMYTEVVESDSFIAANNDLTVEVNAHTTWKVRYVTYTCAIDVLIWHLQTNQGNIHVGY